MPKIVPSTTLRDNFADVMAQISHKEKYFIVSKKGKPVSAIVNLDFFEDLLALSSPKYIESIKRARENYSKNEILSHGEVFGAL